MGPDGLIYMYIARMTISTKRNTPDCHDKPQDPLRFDTITKIILRLRQPW